MHKHHQYFWLPTPSLSLSLSLSFSYSVTHSPFYNVFCKNFNECFTCWIWNRRMGKITPLIVRKFNYHINFKQPHVSGVIPAFYDPDYHDQYQVYKLFIFLIIRHDFDISIIFSYFANFLMYIFRMSLCIHLSFYFDNS